MSNSLLTYVHVHRFTYQTCVCASTLIGQTLVRTKVAKIVLQLVNHSVVVCCRSNAFSVFFLDDVRIKLFVSIVKVTATHLHPSCIREQFLGMCWIVVPCFLQIPKQPMCQTWSHESRVIGTLFGSLISKNLEIVSWSTVISLSCLDFLSFFPCP